VQVFAVLFASTKANGGFIQDDQQYRDATSGLFFLRIGFRKDGARAPTLAHLRQGFQEIAARYRMKWLISDTSARPRTVISVSKFGHCPNDLLHR